MRTTIRLDDDLLKRAKSLAVQQGLTLTVVIEEAVREKLLRYEAPVDSKPIKLITYSGGGLQPGVDLDDAATLLDLMEAYDAPA